MQRGGMVWHGGAFLWLQLPATWQRVRRAVRAPSGRMAQWLHGAWPSQAGDALARLAATRCCRLSVPLLALPHRPYVQNEACGMHLIGWSCTFLMVAAISVAILRLTQLDSVPHTPTLLVDTGGVFGLTERGADGQRGLPPTPPTAPIDSMALTRPGRAADSAPGAVEQSGACTCAALRQLQQEVAALRDRLNDWQFDDRLSRWGYRRRHVALAPLARAINVIVSEPARRVMRVDTHHLPSGSGDGAPSAAGADCGGRQALLSLPAFPPPDITTMLRILAARAPPPTETSPISHRGPGTGCLAPGRTCLTSPSSTHALVPHLAVQEAASTREDGGQHDAPAIAAGPSSPESHPRTASLAAAAEIPAPLWHQCVVSETSLSTLCRDACGSDGGCSLGEHAQARYDNLVTGGPLVVHGQPGFLPTLHCPAGFEVADVTLRRWPAAHGHAPASASIAAAAAAHDAVISATCCWAGGSAVELRASGG
jgi:hypothetical protein